MPNTKYVDSSPSSTYFNADDFFKIWIKPNGEMPFLYGNHVVKAHLGRITEDTPEHQGVVVFSMNDIPLVCPFDSITHFHSHISLGFWSYCSVNG